MKLIVLFVATCISVTCFGAALGDSLKSRGVEACAAAIRVVPGTRL